MGDHKRSLRFKGIGFDVEVLERSQDRTFIEEREEYWIEKYDTYHNGLNESISGKGYGHRSPNFTTLGYVYSEESRKKMSESAKMRAKREGFKVRSKRSKDNYKNEDYLNKQRKAKKGKRLTPPKLTDRQVDLLREMYAQELPRIEKELEVVNAERYKKNSGWKSITTASAFAREVCDEFNVSWKTIEQIVLWKSRTKKLPSLYK